MRSHGKQSKWFFRRFAVPFLSSSGGGGRVGWGEGGLMDCWSRNVNTTHSRESLFFIYLFIPRSLSLFSAVRARGHSDARTTISPRTFQQRRLRDGMQTLDRVRRGGCAFSELSPPTSPSCQATDSFHSAHTWRATGSSLVSSFLRVGRRQLPIEINYFVGRQLDSRRYDRNVITPITASSNYTLSVRRWYFLNLYTISFYESHFCWRLYLYQPP